MPKAKPKNEQCPKCGSSICDCLTNDPAWLAAKIGKVMQSLPMDGRDRPLTTPWDYLLNRKGRNGTGSLGDDTPTPTGIAQYVYDLLSPIIPPEKTRLLDPCAGTGRYANRLNQPWQNNGAEIVRYEIKEGKDSFRCRRLTNIGLTIANPPFSKGQSISFLRHIIKVAGSDTPIVLFGPADMLFRLYRSSPNWQYIHDLAERISSIIILPRNAFQAIDWPTLGLVLNIPALPPCLSIPDKYLQCSRNRKIPKPQAPLSAKSPPKQITKQQTKPHKPR